MFKGQHGGVNGRNLYAGLLGSTVNSSLEPSQVEEGSWSQKSHAQPVLRMPPVRDTSSCCRMRFMNPHDEGEFWLEHLQSVWFSYKAFLIAWTFVHICYIVLLGSEAGFRHPYVLVQAAIATAIPCFAWLFTLRASRRTIAFYYSWVIAGCTLLSELSLAIGATYCTLEYMHPVQLCIVWNSGTVPPFEMMLPFLSPLILIVVLQPRAHAVAMLVGVLGPTCLSIWVAYGKLHLHASFVIIIAVILGTLASAGYLAEDRLRRQFMLMRQVEEQLHAKEEAFEEREAAIKDTQRLRDESIRANTAKLVHERTIGYCCHHLQQPIHTIKGFLDNIFDRHESGLPEQTEADLMAMWQAALHMQQITEDVLDHTKLQSGHLDIRKSEVELHDLIESVSAGQDTVQVDIHIDQNVPPVVWGDRLRIQQVLRSGMTNAAKFCTSSDPVTFRVRLSGNRPGLTRCLRFEIRNVGRGLLGAQPRILFEPYRLGNVRLPPGVSLGLGLPLARMISQMLHGTVGLVDRGRYTMFWFELPLELPPTDRKTDVEYRLSYSQEQQMRRSRLSSSLQRQASVPWITPALQLTPPADSPSRASPTPELSPDALPAPAPRSASPAPRSASPARRSASPARRSPASRNSSRRGSGDSASSGGALVEMRGLDRRASLRHTLLQRRAMQPSGSGDESPTHFQPVQSDHSGTSGEDGGSRVTEADAGAGAGAGSPVDMRIRGHRGSTPTRRRNKVLAPFEPMWELNVVLVDDEASHRILAGRMFKKLGVSSQLLATADELIRAMDESSRPIDIILLDVSLRHTDGRAVCKELRDDGCTLPIIAMSAQTSVADRRTFWSVGFTALVAKPFTLADLKEAVRQHHENPSVTTSLP